MDDLLDLDDLLKKKKKDGGADLIDLDKLVPPSSSSPPGTDRVSMARRKAAVGNAKDQAELAAPDNIVKQIAYTGAQGALALPAGALGVVASLAEHTPFRDTATHIRNASNAMNDYIETITPNVDPKYPVLSGITQALGYTGGNVLGVGEGFKATRGAIDYGASKLVPDAIAKNSLRAVEKAGEGVANVVGRMGGNGVAQAMTKSVVQALPGNIAAGVGLQAATDPESLGTLKGAALAVGLSAFGALTEGRSRVTELNKIAREATTAKELEDVQVQIKEIQRGGAERNVNDLPSSVQAAYKRLDAQAAEVERIAIARGLALKENRVEKYPIVQEQVTDPMLIKSAQELQDKFGGIEIINPRNTKGGANAGSRIQLDMEPGKNRPSILNIDDINRVYRESVTAYNERLKSAQASDPNATMNLGSEFGNARVSPEFLIQHADALLKMGEALDNATHTPAPPTGVLESSIPLPEGGLKPSSDFSNLGGEPPVVPGLPQTIIPKTNWDVLGRRIPNVTDAIDWSTKTNDAMGDPKELNANSNLPDYSQRIQNGIDTEGNNPRTLPTLTNLYTQLVDGLEPLKAVDKLVEGTDGTQNSVRVAAQLASGSAGKAQQFLENKPFLIDEAGNVQFRNDVKSLQEILKPLKGKLNDYRRAVFAAHTLDEGMAGKNTGITPEDARRELANAPREVIQAVTEANAYRKSLRDYYQSRGLLSEKTSAMWDKLYANYVSLERVFQSDKETGGARGYINRAGAASLTQFKRVIGSERVKRDPIVSDVEQTRLGIKAADRNWVGVKLANLALSNPKEFVGVVEPMGLGTKETAPQIFASASKLVDAAHKAGVEMDMHSAMELATTLGHQLDAKNSVLSIYRNGMIEQYKVAPEIAAAYQSMSPKAVDFFEKVISAPSRGLKAGTVDNPVFGLVNAFRDTFDAAAQTKYGFNLGVDSFRGFMESIKNGEVRQRALAAGGGLGGITSADATTNASAFRSILPTTLAEKGVKLFAHPLEALRAVSIPFEEAARLGEFMRAKEAGVSDEIGAYAMRNVTTDFAQKGASGTMQFLSQITAFMNPAVQSLTKNFQSASTPKGAARILAMGVSSLMMPTMALYAANYGDQEIADLRKANNSNWYFRLPSGEIGKVVKPFLYGQIFATGTEAALDKIFEQDPGAGKRLLEGVLDNAQVAMIPTALQAYINIHSNKDAYSGVPIIPNGLQGVDPQAQVTERTSESSKAISSAINTVSNGHINVSPLHLDYITRAFSGELGSAAYKGVGDVAVSKGKVNGPAPTFADTPLMSRFIARYPSSNVEPIRTFYDRASELNEKVNTLKLYEKQGNVEKFKSYLHDNKNAIATANMYAEGMAQLGKIRQSINEINHLPDESYSREEKRKFTDHMMRTMITVARSINDSYGKVQKQLAVNVH